MPPPDPEMVNHRDVEWISQGFIRHRRPPSLGAQYPPASFKMGAMAGHRRFIRRPNARAGH